MIIFHFNSAVIIYVRQIVKEDLLFRAATVSQYTLSPFYSEDGASISYRISFKQFYLRSCHVAVRFLRTAGYGFPFFCFILHVHSPLQHTAFQNLNYIKPSVLTTKLLPM